MIENYFTDCPPPVEDMLAKLLLTLLAFVGLGLDDRQVVVVVILYLVVLEYCFNIKLGFFGTNSE